MKVPEGVTVHAPGGPYRAGDDIPDEIYKGWPDDHPLKSPPRRPAPAVDKGK